MAVAINCNDRLAVTDTIQIAFTIVEQNIAVICFKSAGHDRLGFRRRCVAAPSCGFI